MEKIVLLIHGYKHHKQHDFDEFYSFAKDKISCPIEKIYWFNNYKKETLTVKSFLFQIDQVMNKYKNYEVIIISYSMGATIFLTQSYKWKNISNIISIFPTFYISYFDWIFKIKKTLKLRWKLKRKLTKERYKRLLKKTPKAKIEKYPISLMIKINKLRVYLLKNVGKIENKNLHIFLNKNDEVNKTKKTFKLIKKKIEPKNIITYYWIEDSHYTGLLNNPTLYYRIINLLNI